MQEFLLKYNVELSLRQWNFKRDW